MPQAFIVENVPEFAKWTLYPAWCAAMCALGYALSPMILDAADHGVPQHRKRLFIVGTKSKHPVLLDLPKRDHVPASNVIDFAAGTWAVINRKGRASKTLARVDAGRAAYGEQFLVAYYGNESGGRSLNRPLGTVTTRDRYAVVNGDSMRMLTADEYRKAMGFPDGYMLPTQHRAAVHMLGNAVTPQVPCDLINALRLAA